MRPLTLLARLPSQWRRFARDGNAAAVIAAMRPHLFRYRWRFAAVFALLPVSAGMAALVPYLTKVAVDDYLLPAVAAGELGALREPLLALVGLAAGVVVAGVRRRRPLRAHPAAHRSRAAERAPRNGLPAHPPPPPELLRPQPDRLGPHPGDERRGGPRREPRRERPLPRRGPAEDGRVPRDDVLAELEGDPRPPRDAAGAARRDGLLPAPGAVLLPLGAPGALGGDRLPPGMPRRGQDGAALRGGGEGARRLRAAQPPLLLGAEHLQPLRRDALLARRRADEPRPGGGPLVLGGRPARGGP